MSTIKDVKKIMAFAIAAAVLAFAGSATWVGAQSAVTAVSVPTYATPLALSLANVSYLATGAIAEVPNMGQWQYQPTCPAFCDGTATCVTAAGVDGGLGCWTVPQAVPACVQALWTINPSTGSDSAAGTSAAPLATLQEWSRRVSGCTVNVQMTVTMAGSAAINGDWPAFPNIGPRGYLTLDCQPGATVLYTSSASGLTAVAAHSGNLPNIMTDSAAAFTTSCHGGDCAGYRIRITTGARAGTVAWIVKDTATTITISDPELDPYIATPTTRPSPGYSGLTSEVLAVGDRYVIEQLALVNTPVPPATIAADESNNDGARLTLHSCASSVTMQYPTYSQQVISEMAWPLYGQPDTIAIVAGYPGWNAGAFAAYASLFDNFFSQQYIPGVPFFFGCAFMGNVSLASGYFYQGTVIQEFCGANCPYANGSSQIASGAINVYGSLGILGGGPFVLGQGTSLKIDVGAGGVLWGTPTSGVCISINSGAFFTSNPYTCGDAGATTMGTSNPTTFPWSSITDAGGMFYNGAWAGL